jgi:hypothetical protein
MLHLFKPIVLQGLTGLLALAVGRFIVVQPLFQWVLYGAGVAFIAIALWTVTAMVTGWNLSTR